MDSHTSTRSCGTCMFFRRLNPDLEELDGECLRYPPVIAATDEQQALANEIGSEFAGSFPLIDALDWCGEYIRKEFEGQSK